MLSRGAIASRFPHRPWVSFTLHPTTTAAVGPNILLISIDSLRSDHLSCYGYGKETSPTIDRLADTGALFETVVSPTSWTLPAHHTLLTGLAPERHGVIYPTQRLDTDVTTLAEVLRDAGYVTFGVVSGSYLDASYGFHQGFEVYDEFSSLYRADIGRVVTSPSVSRATEGWLHHWDREERGRPCFAFLHMWDVHHDYNPPAPYDTIFDPDYSGNVTSEDFTFSDRIRPTMDSRDLDHILALYDGEIRYTDYYVDQILDVVTLLSG